MSNITDATRDEINASVIALQNLAHHLRHCRQCCEMAMCTSQFRVIPLDVQRQLKLWGIIAKAIQGALDARAADEPSDANSYALNLLNSLVDKFGRPEGFQAEDDLLGKLLQIDNVVAGLLARASQPPSAWQPIETAPKGGKWVLLWWPAVTDAPFVGYCVLGEWRAATSGDKWPNTAGPTHWMPLPAPPDEASDDR